jgi:flagellin
MRIQHNISAMNSYRNFSTNNSNLSKNLEKLSTGYKINRAGDDAAGLAISEKMRAQITGLEGATKNAKDGISLIQTAEGALTEVHSMLNRMTTLAEQSANGTYDDSLDRQQLQKEVEALKSEIDRIADSTNYNGIKLLDGSLSGGGNLKGKISVSDTVATANVAKSTNFAAGTDTMKVGDALKYTVTYMEDGKEKTASANFKVTEIDTTANTAKLVSDDGTEYTMSANGQKLTDAVQVNKAVVSELQKDNSLTKAFTITADTDATTAVVLTSNVKGTDGAKAVGMELSLKTVDGRAANIAKNGNNNIASNTAGVNAQQKLDLSNVEILKATDAPLASDVERATFEIDGKKFLLIGSSGDYDKTKEVVGSDVNIIKLADQTGSATGTAYAIQTTDGAVLAAELSRITGKAFTNATAADTTTGWASGDILFDYAKNESPKLSRTGKALDLQIGDTADSFNKMSVAVKDMHVKSIGVGDVDISDQKGAAEALNKIKTAINNVSDQRGSLGALQNRLDHTLNNLGVMRENIQNAESLIRDTDIAEEMMAYTKNNILNQSAQAMLAQANQLPQGVLQLIQ